MRRITRATALRSALAFCAVLLAAGCDRTEEFRQADVDGDTLRVKETKVTRDPNGDVRVTERITERRIVGKEVARVETRTKTVEERPRN